MYNVFLCRTRLQLKIANKIVDQSQNNIILFLSDKLDDTKLDDSVNLLHIKKYNFFYICYSLYKELRWLKTLDYSIFVSSTDNYYFQLLILYLKPRILYTFDDGSFNLKSGSTSQLRKTSSSSIRRYIFNSLLKAPSSDVLQKMSNKHFAIFKDSELYNDVLKNKLIFIKVLSKGEIELENRLSEGSALNVYVGSCFEEVSADSIGLIARIKNHLLDKAPIVYIPHPRCNKDYGIGFYTPIDDLIETYVLDKINQGYSINFIGLLSTSHLLLNEIEGVTLIVLDSSLINEYFRVDETIISSFSNLLIENIDFKT